MVTSTVMDEQRHVVHDDQRLHERLHGDVTSLTTATAGAPTTSLECYHDVTSAEHFHRNVPNNECFLSDVASSNERFVPNTNVAHGSVSSACLTALSYCHDYGIGKSSACVFFPFPALGSVGRGVREWDWEQVDERIRYNFRKIRDKNINFLLWQFFWVLKLTFVSLIARKLCLILVNLFSISDLVLVQ